MKRFLLSASLLAGLAIPATSLFAADEAADVAKDVVDPYSPGTERTRFLAAAGVDSELDEKEFKSNLDASDPFVRKFDAWATLKGFDGNSNGTIDWFEADGYRRAVRTAMMGSFDKNKDGKLDGDERSGANEALAAGKLPKVNLPSRERPGTAGGEPGQPGRGEPGRGDRGDRGGFGRQTDEERAAELKKFDKDGNGELNGDERRAAFEARIEAWRKANPEEAKRFDDRRAEDEKRRADFTKKYDKDGNGELSDEERRAGFEAEREVRAKEWKERDPEGYARFEKAREDFMKKHDRDGDGKLSDDERRAGFEAIREEGRKKWDELSKKYDKDGDGQLSREERQELFEKERENLRGFFPFGSGGGGPGGDRGRGDRGGDQNRNDNKDNKQAKPAI